MTNPLLLAAVDLGSNSFRLIIGRVEESDAGVQIFPIDSLKETVRLGAGIGPDKRLDAASQARAIVALQRFGERLRSFAPEQVRVVGTNALRVAKNAPEFLATAEATLGFPVEVIAGREEARLIYYGVAHSLPTTGKRRLVMDIGGGSTEFIIGTDYQPQMLESLFIGCVSFTRQFFPGGVIDRGAFKDAILAARREIAVIAQAYQHLGWDEAVGSSGSARAICDVLELNGFSEHGITADGLERLKRELIKAGHVDKLTLDGLKGDRAPVLAGGLAIMIAAFEELGLQRMEYGDGALRLGVLYDLLGRRQHDDMRPVTVAQFVRRYAVDQLQADRVSALGKKLFQSIATGSLEERDEGANLVAWAGQLHEIGLSIAHNGYHRHSAYIVTHADMQGFSRRDQARLAALVLGHTGKLPKLMPHVRTKSDWWGVLALRLAVLIHRRRTESHDVPVSLRRKGDGVQIAVPGDWLDAHPLTEYSIRQECADWQKLGMAVSIERLVQAVEPAAA